MRRLLPFLLVLATAGCGGQAHESGTATLWVTRDRGADVLLVRTVPAGLTAMQALDRVADIETSYGGRYAQSIEGIDGSLFSRRDWFYFVNGIEGDRSAAEVRLHPGDVEWWDYRSWDKEMRQPVVVGAFPEPFLHGRTYVFASQRLTPIASGIARLTHGLVGNFPQHGTRFNYIAIVPGHGFKARVGSHGITARLGVETARRLIRNPSAVRYRYEVP
ncbi:MAG: DUF4430 domain-containing protein [Actinobacteria bacterium]|nr:DUF4430 domain-containing protein [Actinomycetota bacterium]